MSDADKAERQKFLHPVHPYRGEFTPENVLFDANLQEFAARISYICALETGGKIAPLEAYQQIKALYRELKRSKRSLGVGQTHVDEDDKG